MKKQIFSILIILAGLVYAANEISVNGSLQLTHGLLMESRRATNLQITQSSAKSIGGVQVIGTAPTAISYGAISTPGYAYFRNIGVSTNAVVIQIGIIDSGTNFQAVVDLAYSEIALFRITSTATLYAQANFADAQLDKMILED